MEPDWFTRFEWKVSLRQTFKQPCVVTDHGPPDQFRNPCRNRADMRSSKPRSCRECHRQPTRHETKRQDWMRNGEASASPDLLGITAFPAGVEASQDERQQRSQELHVTVFKRLQ